MECNRRKWLVESTGGCYSGTSQLAISEANDGLYVRADRHVFRISPDDCEDATLYATKWGRPYANARIVSFFDNSQLQTQPSVLGTPPPVAEPLGAVEFWSLVVTNWNGMAKLQIRAGDPGNSRTFIDGQVYGIRSML